MRRRSRVGSREAAAAAAAALAAGGLALERAARRRRAARRAYRLRPGEPVPEELRRIARGQLDAAAEELDRASDRRLGEAVHEARKRFKRLRAAVRLARDGMGEESYRRENAAFRDMGRRLSGPRDAEVLVQTLDRVVEGSGGALPAGAYAELRAALAEDRRRAMAALRDGGGPVREVVGELRTARSRTERWAFAADGPGALEPGLRRVYRRGRRRLRAAEAEPSDENLHELRKRAKDLWHAAQILHPADPKRTRKLARRAHALSDRLGDDHDLAVLAEHVRSRPERVPDPAARAALLAAVDRRRADLRAEALELGRRVYRRPPKRFARAIARRAG